MRRASQEDTTSFKGPPPVPTGYTSWQQVPFTDIDQQIYLGTPSLPKSSEAPPKAPVKVPPKPPPKASAKARTPKHPPPTRDQVDDQGRPLDTAPKASGPRYSTHPGEQPSRPDVEFYGLDVIQQFAIQAESPPDTLPAPIHTAPVQLTEIPSSSQPPQYADFDWSQPPLPEAELCKRCKAELIPDVGKCGRCGQTRPTGWDCGAQPEISFFGCYEGKAAASKEAADMMAFPTMAAAEIAAFAEVGKKEEHPPASVIPVPKAMPVFSDLVEVTDELRSCHAKPPPWLQEKRRMQECRACKRLMWAALDSWGQVKQMCNECELQQSNCGAQPLWSKQAGLYITDTRCSECDSLVELGDVGYEDELCDNCVDEATKRYWGPPHADHCTEDDASPGGPH